MNQTMLALAATAVFSASTAFAADIQMFGHAHVDLRTDSPDSRITVNNNSSTLGLKASTDFAGFKAYFKHVFLVDGLDDSSLLGENDKSYVNVYGDFGSVRLGHQTSSAGLAYEFTNNNHLSDSIADFSNIGFTEYETTKVLVYELPVYAGFTLAIGANSNGNTTRKLFASPSLGLMYDNGHGMKLGLGYEIIDDRGLADIPGTNITAAQNDSKMLQLGGSYTLDNIMVGAQFEQTSNLLLAESGLSSLDANTRRLLSANIDGDSSIIGILPQDDVDRTAFGVAGKLTFGNNMLSVNLGAEKIEKSTDKAKNYFASIALNHTISKRVNTYIAFRNKNTDVASMQKIIGSNNSLKRRALAVGLQYTF